MGAPVTSIMRLCHIIWESSILLKIVIQTGRITDETHKTCWGKIANVLSQKSVKLNRAYVWWSESESFSRFSWVRLFVTPWTVAHQAPLSMGFSRQEYWSGLPFPSPGDLPDPGIEPRSPLLKLDSLPSEPPGKPHMSDKHKQKEWNKPECYLWTGKNGRTSQTYNMNTTQIMYHLYATWPLPNSQINHSFSASYWWVSVVPRYPSFHLLERVSMCWLQITSACWVHLLLFSG